MADADRALKRGRDTASNGGRLRILAIAPLPYRSEGAPAFHGGSTVFFAELLPRLARRGHAVKVIADAPGARPGERREGVEANEPNLRVEWFAYEHRSSQKPPTAEYRRDTERRLRSLLIREVEEARPDVVLIGRESVLPFVIGACAELALPTLAISHGPTVAALIGELYPSRHRDELLDGLRRVDVLVAVAEHVAAGLGELGLSGVAMVPNGVDTDRFRPAPRDLSLLRALDIAPERVILAHVSVLRPWKRPLDLVDSAALVLRSDPRCLYLVVGDGPCRAETEARVSQLGIASSFRFTGEVAHADVPSCLNLADVVVQPSEREGLPLVYREAQACGRALLASDIAAAREVIDHGRTGWLFPVGDVGALATRTRELVRDPDLRRRLGQGARAAAEGQSIHEWTAAYEAALRAATNRVQSRSLRA